MAYFTNIRYGKMRLVGRFKTERDDIRPRDKCVIRTDRGKEVGEVLSPLQPVPEAVAPESLWDILRRANPEDLVHVDRLEKESVPRALQVCKELVKKLNLPMKLADVDYVLGGERVIFYFTSETRVDFRELVRQLAHEFRTRIELKQVGARDHARLVGDVGHCGLELCCRSHLKELGGITMDMAKIQKHTADPSKITGRCGKLLCCLRYEYTTYTESREVLPPRGRRLDTKKGVGIVVDQNMLLREVTILQEGPEGERVIVKLDEILGAPASVAGCDGCATGKTAVAPAPAKEEPTDTARFLVQEASPGAPAGATAVAPPRRALDVAWMPLGKVSEFAAGSRTVADLGGRKLAVFNVDGVLHVLANECGHQGGPLGEGTFEGFSVTCPLHQWRYDVTTGHCLSVSGSSVRRYETAVVKDELYVKI